MTPFPQASYSTMVNVNWYSSVLVDCGLAFIDYIGCKTTEIQINPGAILVPSGYFMCLVTVPQFN